MDETETAPYAWRSEAAFSTMGLQFSSGARDVRFSTVPGEMMQNRRAGSRAQYDTAKLRMRTKDDSFVLAWRRNTEEDRKLSDPGLPQQPAEQLILSLRQSCVQAHTRAVATLTFTRGDESSGVGPGQAHDGRRGGRGPGDVSGGSGGTNSPLQRRWNFERAWSWETRQPGSRWG